jgi:hypothetical protein
LIKYFLSRKIDKTPLLDITNKERFQLLFLIKPKIRNIEENSS